MILILTRRDDLHADRVEAILRRRRATVARFDPGDFPSRARLVLEHSTAGPRARILGEAGELDLACVRVAWHRRPTTPHAHERFSSEAISRYVDLELHLALEGLWESLECRWIPGLHSVMHRADQKLKQLRLAQQLGLTVAPTLLTNDAAAMFRFYEENDGRLISKLPSPAVFWVEPRVAVRYTQTVTRADLAAWPRLRHAPMLFQRHVEKKLELRVTVVGEQVFAAAIHSQRHSHTAVDCRTDYAGTSHTAHALDPKIADACRSLTRELGLAYSTVDLILTPEGEHVFLELNPNGQYLWIEDRTGLAISEAVADLLITCEASP